MRALPHMQDIMDIRTFFGKNKMSRGKNSLRSGMQWEARCAERLRSLYYRGTPILVNATAGGGHGQDIPSIIAGNPIDWEAKNNGAFEGGGTTLYEEGGRLVLPASAPLLRTLWGEHVPWGRIPAKGEMIADDYIDVPADSVAHYYRQKGTVYILVEGKGIYHTGTDVLELGVPLFTVEGIRLRTRVTKHMKNGLPTDISAALVFPRKNLRPSNYCLFDRLPPGFTLAAE